MYSNLIRSAQGVAWVCLLGAVLSGCLCVPGINAVSIGDPALESAIRAEVHKPFGCLTLADVQSVRTLNAHALGITSLDGLENCTSLTDLDLSGNTIRNVDALAGLTNLVTLDLSGNAVVRIDALSGLFLLRNVDLHGANNEIRDFGPLTANALNGGLGAGAVVTLEKKWTTDSTSGKFFPDFQDDYNALTGAGVTVIIVDSNSTTK
jgi:hypothetical protein